MGQISGGRELGRVPRALCIWGLLRNKCDYQRKIGLDNDLEKESINFLCKELYSKYFRDFNSHKAQLLNSATIAHMQLKKIPE